MNIYKYIFYKLYRWSQTVNPPNDSHAFVALLLFSLSIMMNIFALPALLQVVFGYQLVVLIAGKRILAVGLGVLIFGINYFVLSRVYGFDQIVAEFENESIDRARRGVVAVTLYVALSPLFFIGLLFLLAMQA